MPLGSGTVTVGGSRSVHSRGDWRTLSLSLTAWHHFASASGKRRKLHCQCQCHWQYQLESRCHASPLPVVVPAAGYWYCGAIPALRLASSRSAISIGPAAPSSPPICREKKHDKHTHLGRYSLRGRRGGHRGIGRPSP
jgi:hypothetical protein